VIWLSGAIEADTNEIKEDLKQVVCRIGVMSILFLAMILFLTDRRLTIKISSSGWSH